MVSCTSLVLLSILGTVYVRMSDYVLLKMSLKFDSTFMTGFLTAGRKDAEIANHFGTIVLHTCINVPSVLRHA